MKLSYSAFGISLILALLAGLVPAPASANDRNIDQPSTIRLYATARFGPIGIIKLNSFRSVAIDGRIVQGEAPVWGGELIKAVSDRTVRVSLDSIGQVSLSKGTSVRISTARASSGDAGYEVLVASIITGSATVTLNSGAGA